MTAWQDSHPCGPSDWKRAPWWLPCVPQFVFQSACREHDAAYAAGGTASDRMKADRCFIGSMLLAMVADAASWRWCYLFPAAVLYYWLVRRRGAARFAGVTH